MSVPTTLDTLTGIYSNRVKERMGELQFALEVAQREGLGENREEVNEIGLSVDIECRARDLVQAMTQYLSVVGYK